MLAKTDAKIIPQTVCDNKKRKKSYFPTVFLTQIKLIDLYQTAKNKKTGIWYMNIESSHIRNLKPVENFLAFNPYLCNAYLQVFRI